MVITQSSKDVRDALLIRHKGRTLSQLADGIGVESLLPEGGGGRGDCGEKRNDVGQDWMAMPRKSNERQRKENEEEDDGRGFGRSNRRDGNPGPGGCARDKECDEAGLWSDECMQQHQHHHLQGRNEALLLSPFLAIAWSSNQSIPLILDFAHAKTRRSEYVCCVC